MSTAKVGDLSEADQQKLVDSFFATLAGTEDGQDTWKAYAEKHSARAVPIVLFNLVVQFVGRVNQKNVERNKQIAALEERVKELEAKPHIKYCGTWQQGQTYHVGNGVTHQGSLWICKVNFAQSRPGEDPVCWQLAVKRGRDGRDGKDAGR